MIYNLGVIPYLVAPQISNSFVELLYLSEHVFLLRKETTGLILILFYILHGKRYQEKMVYIVKSFRIKDQESEVTHWTLKVS
jgi:hypothetical protein